MTNRETMKALLAGEKLNFTPQWIMSFAQLEFAQAVVPAECHYDGYAESPWEGAYPFAPMGGERLTKQLLFNEYIDRVAFPLGWGANAAFGHAGPGEFNKTVLMRDETRFIVEFETGAKRETTIKPHNVHTYDFPIRSEADLEGFVLLQNNAARYHGISEDVTWAKGKGQWTVGWINGFFSGVHYFIRDYAEFMMDLLMEPQFAGKLVDMVGRWNLEAAEALCKAGVDCIGLCDDFGSEKSMLISPALYRQFFLPWHRRLCEVVHGYGKVVHLHSHGAIMPILKDISESGIDILNPLDPDENMDFAAVREAVGPKMILCGGMNKFFFEWDRETQRATLRDTVAAGQRFGPHILMDSGGIPENAGVERVRQFLADSYKIRRGKIK